ncbi:class I glutamine amidotransferase-like protein [Aureobasidium pullulans]|uniref:Class I glutamine amidotransferase-like protein n=1 Tax=Aureobasidium pullulans TaxID=5580 RepID=A0A4S9XY88_AURPU|nr:class I glutamine amidotransferase-like protein [Aureobasidium pullulans]
MSLYITPIMHFALVVYPQFEVLDAFGPTEALHCLGHPFVNPNSQDIAFSVIGPHLDPVFTGPTEGDPSPVKSRVAQTIVPTHTFDAPPKDVDVLIVPGGFGAGPKALHGGDWEPAGVERVVQFLRDQYPTLKHLLTVCNGAGLAARAGILDGQKATTNKQLWPAITALGPKTHWVARARWVVADNGKLWTSSGVSAGTDAMLALIDHIYGKDDQGTLYGDVIKEGMEWNRVYDSEADPFAGSNNVTDVPAQE